MVSRRSFIVSSVVIVGGAAAGIHLYRSNFAKPGERAVIDVIERLAEFPGAVRFGEIFLKQGNSVPDESINSITDRLQKIQPGLDHDNFNDTLEQQIQIELQSRQVHLVDDWYLARTEAELCALAFMHKKSEL